MGDKSKRIKWGQHVVRIGEMRNDERNCSCKPEAKILAREERYDPNG